MPTPLSVMRKQERVPGDRQANFNLRGMAVARGIGQRLLCYAIKMACTRLAQRYLRPDFGAKVHFEAVQIAAAARELAQRERQPARVGAHRQEAARERACASRSIGSRGRRSR